MREEIERFASLSQQMDNAWLQEKAWQEVFHALDEERETLEESNDWEEGVYDVPGGHVVVLDKHDTVSGEITFYPEKI